MNRIVALALWALTGSAGAAQVLEFPGNAVLVSEAVSDPGSHAIATGPWSDGTLPQLPLEGAVTRQVWRIDAGDLDTLQVLAPLRAQLQAGGFEVLLDCETDLCGGFDFRFGIDVAPPPEMFVALGDFRYLSASRDGDAGAEHVSLMVSRAASAAFVDLVRIGPAGSAAPLAAPSDPPLRATSPVAAAPGDLAGQLETSGHAVLTDLAFDTGSAQLGPGPFASLVALADYLAVRPNRQVALVGHTDATGSLDTNIALSRRRAGSVLERLVSAHGVRRAQLAAEGMGYLAPVAANLTEAGREANRRVEVILLSTGD